MAVNSCLKLTCRGCLQLRPVLELQPGHSSEHILTLLVASPLTSSEALEAAREAAREASSVAVKVAW